VLLVVGAIYVVTMFSLQLSRPVLLVMVEKLHCLSPVWQEPVIDALVFVFIAGAILALFVGLFLIFRPSLLRDLELGANQHLPVREKLKSAESQYNQIDSILFRHHKVVGIVLMSASLYVLVGLLYWLGR
jgi:phosphate starvation-inducible membrane PsiE